VPSDILFASASGLDPHISKEAAFLQVNKIARARNFNDAQKQVLLQLIESQTEKPQLLFLGNERINVLLINMMVDKIK
jgi:K+-transporting ATPase ATPase C chain